MGWTAHPMATITPGIRLAWRWAWEPTLGLCWGMLPPGSEGWDVGACGAAQWGWVGFCRVGKQRPPMWLMPALLASLQLRHTGWLCLTLAARPLFCLQGAPSAWQRWLWTALAALWSQHVPSLGGMDLLGGLEAWGLKQALCVYLSACVCVSSGRVTLFHFMPGCARTGLSRASSCWSSGGTGHHAAVSPSCSCCAVGALHSPVLCLKTGKGTRALPGL